MANFVFTKGRLNNTDASFLKPVRFMQGQYKARQTIGGTLVYEPYNQINLEVDPTEASAFIEAARSVLRDHFAPLELLTESGQVVHAVVWVIREGGPTTVIEVQPDDGTW